MTLRPATQRRDHALRRLESEPNVWVATASAAGDPHLVPLSLAWDGSLVLLTTPASTPTARNAAANGRARLALDSAEDVVVIDASVESIPLDSAPTEQIDFYVQRAGWDPRAEEGSWVLLIARPQRVQAWNSSAEIQGRTIMRGGSWVE